MRLNFYNIFPLSIFTVLGLIYCYPIFSPNIILGGGDVFFYLWDLWWVKTAIINGLNPNYCHLLLYPMGYDMTFNTMSYLNGIMAIPLQSFFNLVQTYNILYFIYPKITLV